MNLENNIYLVVVQGNFEVLLVFLMNAYKAALVLSLLIVRQSLFPYTHFCVVYGQYETSV